MFNVFQKFRPPCVVVPPSPPSPIIRVQYDVLGLVPLWECGIASLFLLKCGFKKKLLNKIYEIQKNTITNNYLTNIPSKNGVHKTHTNILSNNGYIRYEVTLEQRYGRLRDTNFVQNGMGGGGRRGRGDDGSWGTIGLNTARHNMMGDDMKVRQLITELLRIEDLDREVMASLHKDRTDPEGEELFWIVDVSQKPGKNAVKLYLEE